MASPLAMTYVPKASSTKPPLIANENAFLGDVISSAPSSTKPIASGFFRLEKGTPLVYTYKYEECKIIVDGSFDITDETGTTVHAVAGDVFFFPDGAKITFTTEDFGLAFYCGQRARDTA